MERTSESPKSVLLKLRLHQENVCTFIGNRKSLFYGTFLFLLSIFLYYETHLIPVGVRDFVPIHTTWVDTFTSIFTIQGLCTVLFFCLILDVFVRWKYWGWMIWFPILTYNLLRVYMYHALAIDDPGAYIGVFLETDWDEAFSYMTLTNICLTLLFILLNVIIFYVGRRLLPFISKKANRICVWCELIVLAAFSYMVSFGGIYVCAPLSQFLVTGLNTQKIIRHGGDDLIMLRQLPSSAEGYSHRKESVRPMTVVFVVGESVRADHLQLFGYERPTTPHMELRRKNGELLTFPHTLSYDTSTSKSVIGMFTNATNETRQASVGSFIPLLNKHGFKTYYMYNLSKQATPTIMLLTAECHEDFYSDSFECEEILDKMRSICSEERPMDRFFVIQTKGSHYHYPNKYPRERFSIFKPDENYEDLSTDNEELVNSYDNSIVYLDYFLEELVKIVEDSMAIVIYCSDHGESFGEGGRFVHGASLDAMEQRRVPFLIWGSEEYRKANPQIWQAMMSRQQEDVQHGNLFHTILGISQIDSQWRENSKDLTTPKPQ